MGFSEDNLKGFILALMSSLFIGASFIIKKKGLRRAAEASGVRAGIGGFSYLLEPLWWLGMITMIIGEVANFVAYAFAPAVLVTPLGALSIIVSAVLAQFILNEKLHQLGILGCVMCIAGSVVIVIHAPQEHPITSVQEICSMATQPDLSREVTDKNVIYAFLGQHKAERISLGDVACLCNGAWANSIALLFQLFYWDGRNEYPNPIYFSLISMWNAQDCGLIRPPLPLFSTRIHDKALDTFNTAVVSPIYYVMFTSLTILASVIMFKDWDGQSVGNIISEICGFIVVLSGTILLHTTKDFERSSSFRGSYASLSPALSARLCSGNGEFMKHDEENQLPAEAVCLQRQEIL
ncbi:hypothetical protein POTOM_034166 [Populus tomentosa]|uniref:Probable magnesium transporter n=1 Tax=Populus tomentosa TaxID=118781 RepID=A0A8X7YY60_POPTO|nr:hypothetical protein POTOM_034166 [Populus tomentosa]